VDASAWSNREIYIPALCIQSPQTTGAGDAAIAGFLASINRGLLPWQAIEIATSTAASCCEQTDATSGVRSWDKIVEMVKDWLPERPFFDPDRHQFMASRTQCYFGPSDQR